MTAMMIMAPLPIRINIIVSKLGMPEDDVVLLVGVVLVVVS